MALIYAYHTRAGSAGLSNSCVAFGQHHDALATHGNNGSTPGARVFKLLVATSRGLVTSRPSLLGVSAQIRGVGVSASTSISYYRRQNLDSIAAMVATVSNAIGMIGTESGLIVQSAAMKVQWYGLRSLFI
jgi:hypothetical protein